MTKLKSKKMTKSTFAVIIMAIAMVALLAFGGTYAYFTATAEKTTISDVKTAVINLTNNTTIEATEANANLLPGETVLKTTKEISLTSTATRDMYVFAIVSSEIKDAESNVVELFLQSEGADTTETTDDKFETPIFTLDNTGWTQLTIDGKAVEGVYFTTYTVGEGITKFNLNATFSEDITSDKDQTNGEKTNVYTSEGVEADVMGISISLTVNFRSTQKDTTNITTEALAWNLVKPAA